MRSQSPRQGHKRRRSQNRGIQMNIQDLVRGPSLNQRKKANRQARLEQLAEQGAQDEQAMMESLP